MKRPPVKKRWGIALAACFAVLAGGGEIRLDSGWLFAPGDDPARKAAGFDDSAWKPIKVPAYWKRAGFPRATGTAWYRARVTVETPGRPMQLVMEGVAGSDETWFNGVRIGGTGEFDADYSNPKYVTRRYDIPPGLTRRENVVAVRVFDGGRPESGGLIRPVCLRELGPEEAVKISARMPDAGFYFAPGEKFRLGITLGNRTDETVVGTLSIRVRDFEGIPIAEFREEVSLAAGAEQEAGPELALPATGIYTVESVFAAGERKLGEGSMKLGALPPVRPETRDPRFGVAAHLNWWENAAVARSLELMARCGIASVRTGMIWPEIEPRRGEFRFDRIDLIVWEGAARGITLLPTLADVPDWAAAGRSASGRVPLPRPAEWGEFVETVVKRYAKSIPAWEIGNEPNHEKLAAAEYAAILNTAYEHVKSADSEAEVMVGGISSVHVRRAGRIPPRLFLEELAGAGARADSLACHPYVGWPGNNRAIREDFAAVLDQFRSAAPGSGFGGRLRLTEYSSSVRPDQGRTETDQARFLVLATATALTRKEVAGVYWYNFRNKGSNPKDNEVNYGLVNYDYSPKEAFLAYHTLIAQLSGLEFEEELSREDGIRGFFFGNAARRVLLVWTEKDDARFTLPGAVSRVNLVGKRRPLENGEIAVTFLPQYIEIRK